MKKNVCLVICALVLFFSFSSAAYALAGGGGADYGDDGGGYDGGGNNYYHNNYYYDNYGYRSSSNNDSGGLAIVVLLIIVVGVFIANQASKDSKVSLPNPIYQSETDLFEAMQVDEATGRELLGKVKAVFLSIQKAWTKQDLTKVMDLYSNELYAKHVQQLLEMKSRNEWNCVMDIEVLGFYNYRKLAENRFVIGIEALVIDYTENSETGEVISGKKNQKGMARQNWEFIIEGEQIKLDKIY